MSEIKLKPCPFCGGKVKIQLTDKDGKWERAEYLKNPENGIGWVLTHPVTSESSACPIAASGEKVGVWIYVSEKSAVEAWNRRAGEQNETNWYREE